MTENNVKQLFKGIQEAILQAQQEIEEQHNKKTFNTYFDANGKPKTIQLEIAGQQTQVPLFTLLPHNTLKIAEVSLDMDLKIDNDESNLISRVFFGTKTNAHLSIKFTENTMPEGMARINNKLTQL